MLDRDNLTIYIVTHKLPPDPRATGGHVHANNLYNELKKKGFLVRIISTSSSSTVYKTIKLSVFHYFPAIEIILFSFLASTVIVFDFLKEKRKIIVNTQGRAMHLVGILLKIISLKKFKFVMTQHATEPFFIKKTIKQLKSKRTLPNSLYLLPGFLLFHLLERTAYIFSDKIVCVSDKIKQECLEEGAKKEKLKVIYNATYPVKKTDKGIGTYFLFLGIDAYTKGLDILLESFNLYLKKGGEKDLYICGIDKIGHSHEKIRLLGLVSGEIKEDAFQNCFALLAPSRYDSGPITVLEALAYNKPVILSKNAGLSDYISSNGFGISTDLNPENISEAMFHLKNDIVYQNFRSKIEDNFNLYWSVTINEYLDLFENLIHIEG